MAFVIITGGFDLSSARRWRSAATSERRAVNGYDTTVAVALGVLSRAAVGLVNGLIITKVKVNPLVTTLGTMTIVRGLVLVETQGRVMTGFPQSFRQLGEGSAFGVFYPVIIFLVLAALADLLLRHSRFLRQTYYVGGNEEAARLSGIDVDRVRIVMYVITGMLAAMAGVITTAKNGSASPIAGTGAELRVIAAVVIGGASLNSGVGTVLGAFLGLLLTGMIANGLGFMSVSFYAEGIITGLILIVAVMIDQLTGERARSLWKSLTTTRSKKMEPAINVALALIVIGLLVFWPRGDQAGGAREAGERSQGRSRPERGVRLHRQIGLEPLLGRRAQGLEDRAGALGVRADFRGASGTDVNEQIKQFEDAMARKPAGIIVSPAGVGITPMINRAIDGGTRVIRRFRRAAEQAVQLRRHGQLQRRAARRRTAGQTARRPRRGLSALGARQPNLEDRIQGYRDALAEHPAVKIVDVGNGRADPNEAAKVARNILSAHPNIAGVGCVDAGGGEGTAVVLRRKAWRARSKSSGWIATKPR